MGTFWDSPFVLSSSCPEASGSVPSLAFVLPILPLTNLPVLCLAFLIFSLLRDRIYQAVESCKPRELSYSRLRWTGFCHNPCGTARCVSSMGVLCANPFTPFNPQPLPLYGAINTTARGSSRWHPNSWNLSILKIGFRKQKFKMQYAGLENCSLSPWTLRVHLVKKESLLYFDISCRFEQLALFWSVLRKEWFPRLLYFGGVCMHSFIYIT